LHGPAPEQKMFRDQTEATVFRLGTVPVPVLVPSLIIIMQSIQMLMWSATDNEPQCGGEHSGHQT